MFKNCFSLSLVLTVATISSATAQDEPGQYVNKKYGFVLDVPASDWKLTPPNFMIPNAVGCVALREYGSTKGLGAGVVLTIHKCDDAWQQFRYLRVAENGVNDLNGTPFYWFKTKPPEKGEVARVQVLQYFLPCDDTTWLFDIRAKPEILKDEQADIDQILKSFNFDLPSIEPAKPLAHFRFNNNAKDISNADSKPMIKNAQFRDDALYLDGTQIPGGANNGTSFSLMTPSLDYRRFTLELRFKADTFEGRHSTIITGGPRTRWFQLSRAKSGKLQLGLDNHRFAQEFADTDLKAGQWYDLTCNFNRYAGYVQIQLNGKDLDPVGISMNRSFTVESQDESNEDKMWSFANFANASTFKGVVDELAIYDRATLKRRADSNESDLSLTPSVKRSKPKAGATKPSGIAFFLISKGKPISGVTNEPSKPDSNGGSYIYEKPIFEITADRIEKYTASPVPKITLTPKARKELAAAMKTPEAKTAGWFVMMQNGQKLNGEFTTGSYATGPQNILLLGGISVEQQ